MMCWLGRGVLRVLVAIAAISLLAYAVDWTVYKLRGSPQSVVAVSQFLQVPLKGGERRNTTIWARPNVPCVVALFPHGGKDPCWNLRRNPNQWDKLGDAGLLIANAPSGPLNPGEREHA